MFKMLKIKQRQEHVPLLKNKDGTTASDQPANKKLLVEYFHNIFNGTKLYTSTKFKAMASINSIRLKTVPNKTSISLEQDLTQDEIRKSINSLKTKKIPRQDALSAEFYQAFSELLIEPLLEVWKESLQYGALPMTINEGLIKLVHKKGPKDEIGNWRPLTMLNCAYKIIAKALALRLKDHMKQWITKN
ncbi:hypothetical protein L7F22_012816 [Adiantum nelumboides]|nr:hypothetical protein [Adiantum nelumboides]